MSTEQSTEAAGWPDYWVFLDVAEPKEADVWSSCVVLVMPTSHH